MKQNKFIKKCGPFAVSSISQDGCGVRLEVYPAFPEYNLSEKGQSDSDVDESWKRDPRWAIHRLLKGEGGGPGIFTVIALAEEFEQFLNQAYSQAEVAKWKSTLKEALAKVEAAAQKRFEKAMKKRETLTEKGH